jgi:hypothetical protein
LLLPIDDLRLGVESNVTTPAVLVAYVDSLPVRIYLLYLHLHLLLLLLACTTDRTENVPE